MRRTPLPPIMADGLIDRKVYPVVPPKVEYSLTDLGRTLVEPLTALGHWAEAHAGDIEAANRRYTEKEKVSA